MSFPYFRERKNSQMKPCILNDEWLLKCIARCETEEQAVAFINPWELAANKYMAWLSHEGFTFRASRQIISAALKKADFDLRKFPVCPASW
jgi:hypothetical protein